MLIVLGIGGQHAVAAGRRARVAARAGARAPATNAEQDDARLWTICGCFCAGLAARAGPSVSPFAS